MTTPSKDFNPEQPDPEIHLAAERADLERVRALLDAEAILIESRDRWGGTPLHRAVIGQSRAAAALLLDRGADLHAAYGEGGAATPGYPAVKSEAIDIALWGGNRTVRPAAWRVAIACTRWWLTRARRGRSRFYHLPTARLLLTRGAAHDLTIAAALGDVDRVTGMLDADPASIRSARPNGRRPLSAATEFGHEAIVRLLLKRGADPTWPELDADRGAALHAAARAGHHRLVELLLAHGADPNGYVDSAGNAVYAAKTPDIRALLVAHGGTLDPYDLVWLDEDEEVLRRVTTDPESADAGCGGVYTAVVTRGKRDLLRRLLDAGVRVPPKPDGCRSYLLEQPDMLKLLLERGGLDPDYMDDGGSTLLHALCARDDRNRTMEHRTACAAMLLDAGATISARERAHQITPLALAAYNNLPDMVEFLLARGAPANLPDDPPGTTPLALAERRGHAHVAELLRRHGATS